jgi:hypothetical protein
MIGKDDFRFRDDLIKSEEVQTVPVEILTGPYKNVIYRYVKVGVKEKDDGEAVLQFIYDILDPGDLTETTIRNDQRFTNHIGLILNHMILEIAENDVDDTREDDTQEPVKQRGLLP